MISTRRKHHVVAVFGSSLVTPGDPDYDQAQACGTLLAESGYVVATGGYGGSMEAVSRGAAEAGGHVIGVTAPAVFVDRSGPNRWVAEERTAESLTERMHELVGSSDAHIALPGSIGTFAELVVSWYMAETASRRGMPAPPIIAVGAQWTALVDGVAAALGTGEDTIVCVADVASAVAEVGRRVPVTRRWQASDS